MKKSILSIAVAALLLGVASMSFAATDTEDFNVAIMIITAAVDVQVPRPYAFNDGVAASASAAVNTICANAAGIRNVGSDEIDLTLTGVTDTVGTYTWVQDTTKVAPGGAPANDYYRLYGAFAKDDDDMQQSDFGIEDMFDGNALACSDTNHGGGTIGFRGYNIPSGEWRNLYFWLDLGAYASAIGEELNVTITVLASN
jgi:hypothetical protein